MKIRVLTLIGLSLMLSTTAHAARNYGSYVEGGLVLHSGSSTGSITGSNSYYLGFGTQDRDGFWRFQMSANFYFSSGTASVSSGSSNYSMYAGTVDPGLSIYPAGSKGTFNPFFSSVAVLGAHFFNLSSPPSGVDENTRGFSFGAEVGAGVDIRFGKGKSYFRLKAAYSYMNSTVGGTLFDFSGWKAGFGYGF